jgi:hypothetical protein
MVPVQHTRAGTTDRHTFATTSKADNFGAMEECSYFAAHRR